MIKLKIITKKHILKVNSLCLLDLMVLLQLTSIFKYDDKLRTPSDA